MTETDGLRASARSAIRVSISMQTASCPLICPLRHYAPPGGEARRATALASPPMTRSPDAPPAAGFIA